MVDAKHEKAPPYQGWDWIACPICAKPFFVGWNHPADQKLYHHMRKGKAHNALRAHMTWPVNNGDKYYWETEIWP